MNTLNSILLGILAAFFSLVLEFFFAILSGDKIPAELIIKPGWFLLFSALSEETIKFSLIYQSFSGMEKKRHVILSSFFLGIGFAVAEIFLVVCGPNKPIEHLHWYLGGTTLLYLFTAAFSGLIVSRKENFYFTVFRATIFNTAVHLLYNLAIIYLA